MRAGLLLCILSLLCPTMISAHADSLAVLRRTQPPCYENGIHMLELGQDEPALMAWSRNRDNLVQPRCYNPTLAHRVIETIVNVGDSTLYPLADSLYSRMWTREAVENHFKTIETEVQRLLPLVDSNTRDQLEQKLKSRDPILVQTVLSWWNNNDPVLSTPINERRIEYFNRLSFARNHFMKNTESVYATDDRGSIYIQYGDPTYKRDGLISPDDTQIRSMLYDMSYFHDIRNPRELFNMRNAILQQFMPQRYEVWVYRNLDTRQSVIYIFGDPADGRSYGLRGSLEEFIPSHAYSMSVTTPNRFGGGPRGYRPAWFIQLGLYNELSTVDAYFGQQLYQYEQNWLEFMRGRMNANTYKSMNSSHEAERELSRRVRHAPAHKSTVAENLDVINQSMRVFTFMDKNGHPYQRGLFFTGADDNLLPNDQKMFFHKNPEYVLSRRLYRVNPQSERQVIAADTQSINPDVTFDRQPASILTLPDDTTGRLLMATELIRHHQSGKGQTEIAASTIKPVDSFQQRPFPAGRMSVSDIVFGYRGEANHSYELWPFVIPREPEQPAGSNLMVYFEVYQLQADSTGIHPYQIEYRINRLEGDEPQPTDIRLQLQFKSGQPRDQQNLEIETSNLQPGTYQVHLDFSSTPNSGQDEIVERTFTFDLLPAKVAENR